MVISNFTPIVKFLIKCEGIQNGQCLLCNTLENFSHFSCDVT